MYSAHEISEEEHRAWFARMHNDHQSRWYVHMDQHRTPDGVVYFTQYRPDQRSAFWGFYIGTEAKQGSGTYLGLEALDEAFFTLKLHKLNAEVLSTNEKSLRFHEKLGFVREGHFREAHFNGEQYIDVVRFGILELEWSDLRDKISQDAMKYVSVSKISK